MTERRDVLAGFFFLASILFYLRAEAAPQQLNWRRASWGSYVLSLLAKATGVTLPALLLIIDAYQFQRAPFDNAQRRVSRANTLLNKIPYLIVAIPISIVAFVGQWHNGAMAPLQAFDLRMRLAVWSHSTWFYLGKTLWPSNLSPLYPLPDPAALYRWPYPGYFLLMALTTFFLAYRARRYPGTAAAWGWYVLALFPVSGFFQSGGQLTADRYSYFPCLAGAALCAGIMAHLLRLARARNYQTAVTALAMVGVFSLIPATRRQTRVWHDTFSLWTQVLKISPNSVSAHNNLGAALAAAGHLPEAVIEFRRALELDPNHYGARQNLQKALGLLGQSAGHPS